MGGAERCGGAVGRAAKQSEGGNVRTVSNPRAKQFYLILQQQSLVVDNPLKCNLALCLAAPRWRCHVGGEDTMWLMWQWNN